MVTDVEFHIFLMGRDCGKVCRAKFQLRLSNFAAVMPTCGCFQVLLTRWAVVLAAACGRIRVYLTELAV